MNEKLIPVEKNSATIYEFKIERALTVEEKRALIILQKLQNADYESYFVGGGVRDELLGIPAHDIDIATSAKPEEMEKLFPRIYDRGKNFGVMAVQSGNDEFEIATFRSDIGIQDHRRPEKVEFTSAEADAKRRDFTINGLFYNPIKNQIIDYVDGVNDLENKIVKFIGEPKSRIDEDYLRMLRAVRFANRFEFKLDETAAQNIKENASKITKVSSERIRDELSKMLLNAHRADSLVMLSELGLLKEIMPELEAEKKVAQPPEFHSEGDVWQHTILALKNLGDKTTEEIAWAVLLHDVGKPETQGFRDHPKSKITFFEHDTLSSKKAEEILKRLKFPNKTIEEVTWAISQHMRIIHAFQGMSERKQQKLFTHPAIDVLLGLTKADLSASIRPDGKTDKAMYDQALQKKVEFESKAQDETTAQVKKFTLITGQDIMEKLKIPSGPKVGEIKKEIEEAFLDGKISTRDQALKMIEELK